MKPLETLVYTLPKSYLRPGATTFNEFKMDGKSQAQFKVFSFYMTLVNDLASNANSKDSKSTAPGQHTKFLIEYLRSSDGQAVVGYRFHFYNFRGSQASLQMKSIVDNFAKDKDRSRKNLRYVKTEVSQKYECCRSVRTVDQYLLDICDQYLCNNTCSTENKVEWLGAPRQFHHMPHEVTPEENGLISPSKSHPLQLFSLKNALKVASDTNEVLEQQCLPENYCHDINFDDPAGEYRDGYYKFPREHDLYQVWYSDMCVETMFGKFLPDYYFFNICKVTLETCFEVVVNQTEFELIATFQKNVKALKDEDENLQRKETQLKNTEKTLGETELAHAAFTTRYQQLHNEEGALRAPLRKISWTSFDDSTAMYAKQTAEPNTRLFYDTDTTLVTLLGRGKEKGSLSVQLGNGDTREFGERHLVPYDPSKHDPLLNDLEKQDERLADTAKSDYGISRAEDQAEKDIVNLVASDSEDEYENNGALFHRRVDMEMGATSGDSSALKRDVAGYKSAESILPVVDKLASQLQALECEKLSLNEEIDILKNVEIPKLKGAVEEAERNLSVCRGDAGDNANIEDYVDCNVMKLNIDKYRFIIVRRSNLFEVYEDILEKYTMSFEDAKAACGEKYKRHFDYGKEVTREAAAEAHAPAWIIIHETQFQRLQAMDKNFFYFTRSGIQPYIVNTVEDAVEVAVEVEVEAPNPVDSAYTRENMFDEDSNIFNVAYGDEFISPALKTIMHNKHAVDALDLIKLKGTIFKQHNIRTTNVCSRIQDFENNCYFADDSSMSSNGAKILQWARENMNKVIYNEKSDHSYSIFANRIIRLLHWYEQALFVANAHSSVLLLQHVKYDAYRQELNLHFNVMTTGAGATSKTFTFEIVALTCIPGTVSELTFQTTKADAIDGDRNDTITIFNEAPPGLFMSDNKDDNSEAEAMIKEKLTSQTVTCKEFYRDPDTLLRCNRTSKSQSIGSYMGATNDKKSTCKEAMSTRFLWKEYEKFEKGDHNNSIQEMMQKQRDYEKHDNCNGVKDICMYYHHVEQFRVYVVWKYIYAELLPKPNLTAADLTYGKVSGEMKKSGISIPERTKERFDILCKTHVIIHALESTFNVEGGAHACTCCKHEFKYEGAVGSNRFPEHCKRVNLSECVHQDNGIEIYDDRFDELTKVPEKMTCEQWVFYMRNRYIYNNYKDSEGKAFFKGEKYGSLSFESTHVDQQKTQCIECWKLDKNNGCNKCFFLYDVMNIKNRLYCTEEIALFALTQIEEEIYNVNSYKVKKALWNIFLENLKYKKGEANSSGIKEEDYNYARFGRPGTLITSIQNRMDAKHGRMSENNIEALLKQWNKTSVKSTPYYPHFRYEDPDKVTQLDTIAKDYFESKRMEDSNGYTVCIDKVKIPDTKINYEKYGAAIKHGPKNIEYASVAYPSGHDIAKDYRIYFREEKNTYFHMSIFDDIRYNQYVCPITSSIKKGMSYNARLPKKILLGKCERKDGIITNPRFLDHVEIPRGGDKFEYTNSKYITEEQAKMNRKSNPNFKRHEDQKHKKCLMEVDVDVFAMNEHIMAQNDYQTIRADLQLKEEEMNDAAVRLPTMTAEYGNCDVNIIVNKEALESSGLAKAKIPAIMDRDQVWYPYDFMKRDSGEKQLSTAEREAKEAERKRVLDALSEPRKKKRRRR